MFTGIIESIGNIAAKQAKGGDIRLQINTGKLDLNDVKLGDSIAVNGICLTVISLASGSFSADVSVETLNHSTLQQLSAGSAVNLEKALTLSTRLGGHMVSGHVDGVGEVVEYLADARSVRVGVKLPNSLMKYLAQKGSICVDGVSLTVNRIESNVFYLNIVPHTVQETIIDTWKVGTEVNVEVDVVARYLERLLMGGGEGLTNKTEGVTEALLAKRGFL